MSLNGEESENNATNETKIQSTLPEKTVEYDVTKVLLKPKEESVAIKSLPERIPAFGLICSVISVFFGSLQSVFVRLLPELNPIQILVFRCIVQFIVYGIAVIIKRYHPFGPKQNRLYMIARCLSATVMFISVYLAYKMMPIGDAATIHFSSPVFVIIFAYIMLNESINTIKILAGIFALVGVIVIAKPKFLFGNQSETVYSHRLEGTILAIVAAITAAYGQVILRKIKSTPVAINVLWFSVSSIATGLIILFVLDAFVRPSGWRAWSILFSCGILGVLDQYMFTLAFQYENAGPISVARTLNIVFTFIWGVVILSEELVWTSVVGACIVSFCIVLLGLNKWKTENPLRFKKLFGKLFFEDRVQNRTVMTENA